MNYSQTPEFEKDVKILAKKIPTLESDLERVKLKIKALYIRTGEIKEEEFQEFRKNFFSGKKAAILFHGDGFEVVKMRLDTDSDTYRNRLRLIFVAIISQSQVNFIELYSKNATQREDFRRIKKYAI